MSYTKRTDLTAPDAIVIELDTGDLVAVRCDRKRVDSGVCYHAQARSIDATGADKPDAQGRAVATEFKHSEPADRVEALGDDAITRDTLLAVLGEPVTVLALSDVLRAQVSIRASLVAAPISGAADAGAVL